MGWGLRVLWRGYDGGDSRLVGWFMAMGTRESLRIEGRNPHSCLYVRFISSMIDIIADAVSK